ncbi:DUF433 domain-containing protein [Meiothermus sp. CFH 77666]|uniref:DUF433 domain-containing protein n=1 Tax=Meiothermus sp. CFH 77666 TaxID=2817942 RepID=UPI001AA0409D|nr:DUF433 domain-containing protein [Meiothermus sp. CFH 77666]MBO1437922.1 DUF433 domain-containing protein [Meiothermus sp. CFH 77666]
MDELKLLERITVNPNIFSGKPIIRGRRLAVEHVLGMIAAGDTPELLLQGYPWLEKEDIQACLVYARRMVGHERIEPLKIESAARSCSSILAFGAAPRLNFRQPAMTCCEPAI